MLQFSRINSEPFIEPKDFTVAPDAVTTPDVLKFKDELILFVGAVSGKQERIISQNFPIDSLVHKKSGAISKNARVVLEPGPNSFDNKHVFDPATIIVKDKIFLFYSAIGSGEDSIGLAISADGKKFIKQPEPILTGRSPEIIKDNENLILYYVKKSIKGSYQVFAAFLSSNAELKNLIHTPTLIEGQSGTWDHIEVTTPRVFKRNGIFYMVYAGCDQPSRKDVPNGFGLARSEDLLNWYKYPNNPVFKIGNPSSWDDGAIWFGTVFEWNDDLYLVYEGGQLEDITSFSPAITRVGLAKISGDEFDRLISEWSWDDE